MLVLRLLQTLSPDTQARLMAEVTAGTTTLYLKRGCRSTAAQHPQQIVRVPLE
jgi:hypothetical protein